MYAFQPSDNLDDGFQVAWQDPMSGLGLTEQLYTARGSQGFGINQNT